MTSSTPRQRGYPVEIFGSGSQVNEKFLCSLCHLVLRVAVQRYCGHRYCKDCVDTAADMTCPACEREGQDEELPPDETVPQVDFFQITTSPGESLLKFWQPRSWNSTKNAST